MAKLHYSLTSWMQRQGYLSPANAWIKSSDHAALIQDLIHCLPRAHSQLGGVLL